MNFHMQNIRTYQRFSKWRVWVQYERLKYEDIQFTVFEITIVNNRWATYLQKSYKAEVIDEYTYMSMQVLYNTWILYNTVIQNSCIEPNL